MIVYNIKIVDYNTIDFYLMRNISCLDKGNEKYYSECQWHTIWQLSGQNQKINWNVILTLISKINCYITIGQRDKHSIIQVSEMKVIN